MDWKWLSEIEIDIDIFFGGMKHTHKHKHKQAPHRVTLCDHPGHQYWKGRTDPEF